MTDLLSSIKADLLDRRLLPLLVLACLGLAGAAAYAVLGAGSSSVTSATAPPAPSAPTVGAAAGISITQAPSASNQAVAETTSGAAYQRAGATRDPFAPLPGSATSSNGTTPAASPSTSPSSGSPGTSTPSSGQSPAAGSSPATAPAKPKTKAPRTIYKVDVLFGAGAPGSTAASAHLSPYDNLARQQPLPSAKQPLVVFRGVTAGGKSAIFTLVGEVILHGSAKCLPSTAQCQSIALAPDQLEELEYLPPSGAAIVYKLEVVLISPDKASAAIAHAAFKRESKAGRKLLRRIGRAALPGLHYSLLNGVLSFARRAGLAGHAPA